MRKFFVLVGIFLLLVIPLVLTDDLNGEEHNESEKWSPQLTLLIVVSIISGITILASLILRSNPKKFEKYKKFLFLTIIIPLIFASLFLIGQTVYENTISITKGPVHWHADFEIYMCDEEIDLIDPKGLSNRIGTTLFHEHNDFRIHVEGTVFRYEDVSLSSFFKVIGGRLTEEIIVVPTDNGLVYSKNGDLCDGDKSILNIFVYKTSKEGIVTQEKITDIDYYKYAEFSMIPPGDCIIFEFGPEKQTTDKICKTYEIALEKGKISYGG